MLAHPRLLLVLFCLLCWLPGWFTIPATDRDEARFVQATRQMLETGDFVAIRNGTEARNRKPIGIYWLQVPGAAAARALGLATQNPVWPYRLPSLLGALLAVLATDMLGRRLFDPATALLAAAMLGGSMLLTIEAHIAKTDAALAGAVTLAMLVLAHAHRGDPVPRSVAAVFWLAVAAGILLKGPVLPLVVGAAVLLLVLVERRGRWLRALHPGWGVPLAAAAVLPWFVAIGVTTHGDFFRDAVGGDLGSKLAGGAETHGAPFGYHLLLLSATLFPSGWAAFAASPAVWRRRREPATRFLLAWLAAWVVFEAVPTKLPHYILPLLPPLCLLAATGVTDAPRWLRRGAGVATLGVGIGLTAGVVTLCVLSGFAWWQVVLAALPTGVAAGAAWTVPGPPRTRLAIGLAAVPALYVAVLGFVLPSAAPVWLSRRIAAAAGGAPLAAAGYAEPSLMFAAGTATQFLDPEAAAAWLDAGPGRAAAVEARVLPQFLSHAHATAFAMVAGIDYSNGRWMTVQLFRAAR